MRPPIAALACLCLALSACGDTASDSPAGGGNAVTIHNKLGTASVDGTPERVVAPWTEQALAGERSPELLDTTSGVPLEQVAALKPDLILATNSYGIDRYYDKLAKIAPVVTYAQGDGVDSWQSSARRIAKALGREQRARELVRQIGDGVARVRREHPEFDGSTISFFNLYRGDPWVINSASDFSIRFLSGLGFRLPRTVAALKGSDGRAQVSAENLDVLEADVILATSPDPESLRTFERGRLFRRLDTVRRGAYVSVDLSTATSMAFPSLLGVPYSLREVVPKLAEALR